MALFQWPVGSRVGSLAGGRWLVQYPVSRLEDAFMVISWDFNDPMARDMVGL